MKEKYELKRSAFCLKSEIRLPLNKRGGIVENVFVFKKIIYNGQI